METDKWYYKTVNNAQIITQRLRAVTISPLAVNLHGMCAYYIGTVGEDSFRLGVLQNAFGGRKLKLGYFPILDGRIYAGWNKKNVIDVTVENEMYMPLQMARGVFESIVQDFYYETHYSLEDCQEYMTHVNITDLYCYDWVKEQDGYLFTFRGSRGGVWADVGKEAYGSAYYVQFNRLKGGTAMRISFAWQQGSFRWTPVFVPAEDVHTFWFRKLGMKLKKVL
ncbi:MAG: hypothetical protein HFJ01_06170 [Lachnospiraceae bacterium]|jgi:hypothetical protein|nr:hypothetical protein [Lachnospiraceae bacterium]